jgi:hypothetical protein
MSYESPSGPEREEAARQIDRCPSCGQSFYPGLGSRHCRDCHKPLCSFCKKKYNDLILCKACHQKRTANPERKSGS